MFDIRAGGIAFTFDPDGGFLRDLVVTDGERQISPLHTAPWVISGEAMDPDTPVHLARLAGDFFCAPFAGVSDGSPMHGWPANGTWDILPGPGLRAVLDHAVHGARVEKELTLIDGHPFVYQNHVFRGGSGTVTVANHAMVSLPNGGTLRFSPKRWFETSADPQETDPARGRSALVYPARVTDPAAMPLATGGTVDITRFPYAPGHEDFVVGVEAAGHALGWTAVTRAVEGDLYLSLRHAQRLPMTMMWHSHLGRDYAPWLGRHAFCLGVEEGAAPQMLGIGATESPDPLTAARQGTGITLAPEGRVEVRHVIGAIAWPSGEAVADIRAEGDTLVVIGEGGARREVPFDAAFLS